MHVYILFWHPIYALTGNIPTVQPKMIITGDERVQGTETYPLKENIDIALKESDHEVERVFVASRTGKKVPMSPGRDVSLEKVCMYFEMCNFLILL